MISLWMITLLNALYRQKVWAVHHAGEPLPDDDLIVDDDTGIVVMTQAEDYICPLTKVELVKPMRNRQCKHNYSHDAIMQYIKTGHQECPVAGCAAKVYAKSLEANPDLERKLEKLKKEKARAKRSKQNDIEDL